MTILDDESIRNEAKLHEIAKIIDNDFFMESIREQIQDGLDGNSTDYLEQFNIKLRHVMDNYDEADYADTLEYRDELYHNIIQWIENKYNITIEFDEDDLLKVVKQVYSFFVVDLEEVVIAFLYTYIRENYKELVERTDESELNLRAVESLENLDEDDRLKMIVLSNIGVMIDKVVGMNVQFDEFIRYAAIQGDIRSVTELYNGTHVLSISENSGVIESIMNDLRDNTFNHEVVVTLTELLISSFNIPGKDDVE